MNDRAKALLEILKSQTTEVECIRAIELHDKEMLNVDGRCCRNSLTCNSIILEIMDGGKGICLNCVKKLQMPTTTKLNERIAELEKEAKQ